jgi:hypothetical protein
VRNQGPDEGKRIESGRAVVVLVDRKAHEPIDLGVVGSDGVLLGAAENVTGHGGCSDREGHGAEEEKEEETGSGDDGDSCHSLRWHRRHGLQTRRLCLCLLPLRSLRSVSPYRLARPTFGLAFLNWRVVGLLQKEITPLGGGE